MKARGDGLGYDLIKAEFHFEEGVSSNTATVWIDGVKQPRCDLPGKHLKHSVVEGMYKKVLKEIWTCLTKAVGAFFQPPSLPGCLTACSACESFASPNCNLA